MYSHGVVATKAYPLHMGHDHVIQKALALCEKVTILVVTSARQTPNGLLRHELVKEAYPNARVIHVQDLHTDDNDPDSSILWGQYAVDILDGEKVDAVFSSETYGHGWASAIGNAQHRKGVEHVLVDPFRTLVPVSGTEIRNEPLENFQYIHPKFRQLYLRRVLLVGAESTGKTTLCRNLAQHYQTRFVPEYGRYYVEHAGGLDKTDHKVIFGEIVNRTRLLRDEIEPLANRVVFWDTDLFTTYLWYRLWNGTYDDSLGQAIYEAQFEIGPWDLVLVCDHEGTEWVNDGMRDQPDTRQDFTERLTGAAYEEPLIDKKAHLLTGSWESRWEQATSLIDAMMEEDSVEEKWRELYG